MTRLCWWLVDAVSRWLEPGEREAVRGDIAECGESGAEALRDVLSLVVRRQAALWSGWKPWALLAFFVLPLGLAVGNFGRNTAHTSSIYIWMYANNWDWDLFRLPGFRHDILHYSGWIALLYGQVICAAGASGFLLGWLSRRTIPVNAVLFCLMAAAAEFLPLRPRGIGGGANAAVFSLTFYRAVFPWIAQAVLVLLPSLWGMRLGFRKAKLT